MNQFQNNKMHGITLIEVIIFTVLLSLLITNTINYLYTIQLNNAKLINEIQDAQKGFIATTAVILLSIGTLAFLFVSLSAAASYADSILAREMRIQKKLNEQACQETRQLIIAKDYFFKDEIYLNDFGCVIYK